MYKAQLLTNFYITRAYHCLQIVNQFQAMNFIPNWGLIPCLSFFNDFATNISVNITKLKTHSVISSSYFKEREKIEQCSSYCEND